ncbi:hypothetical protein MAR_000153 [Mya arenaria]|uniref:Uncharacterized protein n=1 Tax=Mya arenaria TaxID=6604 RepID=A0ABY7F869_MYAAR|nr:hypothetical protein MAR_000153 [Mya arenaria]
MLQLNSTYVRCLMDAKANCNTFRRRREVSSDVVNNLINTARPVENYIAISKEILGEEAAGTTQYVYKHLILVASWQNGSLNEVEKSGHSFNLTLLTPKIKQTAHDMVTSKESGFQTIFDEFNQALKTYSDAEKKTRYDKNDGICARVRIKISQELVLTRDGFNARLEIENGEKSEPRLEELTAVDGSGRLTKGVSGTADWLIIPYSSAAPDADTLYDVGGTLSYSVDGTEFSTALLPDTIIVKPNPSLVVRYFHERYVRGDNPMTPDVEPIVPFSLAVVIMNQGNGVAQALKITSAQPEIIENEKGLLISFKIIGAQLGNESITPSLTVDFGDIYASETKTARWLMTSTLMGTFYNYSATFENINPLGDPQLSIIDKLDYHELFHSVRIVYPFGLDDGLDDFLVNDRVDQDGIPDRLYTSSDASVVFDVFHANISVINFTDLERSSKHHTNVTFEVTCTASGWIYARIFNSFSLDIIYAEETDVGRSLLIDKNIWTTTHITDDNLVHLVDKITEHDTVKCIKHYTVTFGIRNKFPPHANFTNNIQHFNISNRVNIGHTVVTFAIDDKDGDSVSAFVRNETTMEFVLRRISENKFSIQVSSVPPIGRYEIEIVMMDNGFPALTATDVVQINVMEVPFNVPDSSTIAQDTSPRTSATTFSNSTLTSTAQQTESSSTPKDKVSSSTIIRPSPCLLLGTVYVFIQYSVVITCFL